MMKTCTLIVCVFASSMAMAGDPSIPGHHPLAQAQAGRVLISELRCAACHTDLTTYPLVEKTAPSLVDVGNRISPDYLRRFLASPSTTHPGTSMPDMLAMVPEAERPKVAEALTHFLVAQSKAIDRAKSTGPIDRELGNELFHSIGCVACHGPKLSDSVTSQESDSLDDEQEELDDPVLARRKAIKASAIPLEHVETKYAVQSLSEFLFQPLEVRPSGRMPDMKLTPAESLSIAGFLIGDKAPPSETLVPEATLVEAGKKHFHALNCAACHAIRGIDAAPTIGSLKTANLTAGCLSRKSEGTSDTASKSSPRFDLDVHQISAISAAIRDEKIVESDKDLLAVTLTTFRCIHCHVRDEYGGVHDDHSHFFQGSQLNLGDDGRIPPPLTWMGAKLQPSWMKKVLFDGESVRHYMSTRMPQYGANNLHHLPELFRRLDVLDGPEMKIPIPENLSEEEQPREKMMRSAGRELLGDKGANCVACHTFNGKAASANQGIELLTSYERLQPAWFHLYLQKPGAFRPRTVMPSAWPDGVASFTTILDGDTHRQIEAIWYYLSLGTSAADPSGVRAAKTKLEVGEQAVLHRGRSRVAGFRGIAVGLPEKLSYAFNAETGTLSAIWQGDFIHVNWSGQGSGDFSPASEPIQLAQDVSFAPLEDADTPWPLLPVMTKEAPANPNPLYPKNVGYQFRGYYLDDSMTPTFRYQFGDVEIEERSTAINTGEIQNLKRVMRFKSKRSASIWFRVLVGDIQQEGDRIFRNDRLRVSLPMKVAILRAVANQPQQLELLLPLQIPEGQSTLELLYEPLKK